MVYIKNSLNVLENLKLIYMVPGLESTRHSVTTEGF